MLADPRGEAIDASEGQRFTDVRTVYLGLRG
jgi:hypothetical protein